MKKMMMERRKRRRTGKTRINDFPVFIGLAPFCLFF